ncbi:MAG: hypothetical protein AB9834_12805 [Lentimicrobium sp.]
MKTLIKLLRARCLGSIIICLSVIFLFPVFPKAENIITSGTTVRVSSGTTLVSPATLTIQNGGVLNNAGTVTLTGNLNNLNVAVSNLGTGTINMAGTAAQQINGQNTINNLTISNAAGVNLNGNATVNGVLTLTSGRLNLGSNNLLLGTAATVAGAPSATSMVVASSSGQMRKSFSAAGSFSFPVGDNTATAEYSPVTVTFSGGTYGAGNYVGVNLVNAAYPDATGSYINRYWNVTQSGITGFTCNATFKYMQADVVGTESSIFCVRVLPEPQTNFQVTNTALDLLTANGLTAFGTFTGKLPGTDKILNLTLMLEGFFNGVTMNQAQDVDDELNQFNNFPGNTVDTLSVYLASATSPYSFLYGAHSLNMDPDGFMSVVVPGGYSGNYYIAVFHRSSVQTWSGSSVSFAGSTINYNFTTSASQAYGSNQKDLLGNGTIWGFFTGDVSSSSGEQDGYVDFFDLIGVYNLNVASAYGYQRFDLNGDGFVDFVDLILTYNNNVISAGMNTPQNPAKGPLFNN